MNTCVDTEAPVGSSLPATDPEVFEPGGEIELLYPSIYTYDDLAKKLVNLVQEKIGDCAVMFAPKNDGRHCLYVPHRLKKLKECLALDEKFKARLEDIHLEVRARDTKKWVESQHAKGIQRDPTLES